MRVKWLEGMVKRTVRGKLNGNEGKGNGEEMVVDAPAKSLTNLNSDKL